MKIEEMKQKKAEYGLTNEMISKESGIPVSTIDKIFGGSTKAPRKLTIEAIEKVFIIEEARRKASVYDAAASSSTDILREAALEYGAKKLYTIDDYDALPEDKRMELIDGVLYDMGAPSKLHQKILGELHILFRECVESHAKNCEVYLAPCDVWLDMDKYTMVQPDLLVICREYDLHSPRFEGAPDLVIEIVSPSSRSRDMILKLYKYKNAGVREYWIVDPKYRTVTVHMLQDEDYNPQKYTFEDHIPIGISEGSCTIEFSRIMERIKGWYADE